MQPLTSRQNQVFEFIRATLNETHRAPTMKEIGQALGIRSTNAVSKHLRALERKGYIEREESRGRTIALVKGRDFGSTPRRWSLPVLGAVSSRYPGRLRHRIPRYLSVDELLVRGAPKEACVVMRSADDGVAKAGILRGDLVVVEERPAVLLRKRTLAGVLFEDMPAVRYVQYERNVFTVHGMGRGTQTEQFRRDDPSFHVVGPVVAMLRIGEQPEPAGPI